MRKTINNHNKKIIIINGKSQEEITLKETNINDTLAIFAKIPSLMFGRVFSNVSVNFV